MQAVPRGLFAASAEPFLAKTLPGSRAGSSSCRDVGTIRQALFGLSQVSHSQLSLKPAQLPLPSLLSLLEFTSTRAVSQPEALLHLQSWAGWGGDSSPGQSSCEQCCSHISEPHTNPVSVQVKFPTWTGTNPESRAEDTPCQGDALHRLALPADSLFWQQPALDWNGNKSPV